MLGVVIYYALTRGIWWWGAITAGIFYDALCYKVPLDSRIAYVCIGLLVNQYRDKIFGNAGWRIFSGCVSSLAMTIMMYIMLLSRGNEIGIAGMLIKSMGVMLMSLAVIPVVFKVVERIDYKLGNVGAGDLMVRLEIDAEIIRLRLLLVVMVFVLGYVMYEVHELQVVDRQRYAANVAQQSIRHVRVPGWRGRMFDRNGICVADNRPSHCIAIYPSEPGVRQRGKFSATIDRVDEMVDEIAEVMDREREISKGEIEKHILEQRLLPLIAWRDLDDTAVAHSLNNWALPGVDLITEADRWYPFGESACHILGYVGRGGMGGSEEQRYDFYLKEMEGKAGLESRYDDILRGEAGSQLIRVDVSLFQHSILVNREPEAGSDLQLAMDIRLQNIAERVLDRKRGACCIINPATGHVLALASYPRYDLNEFGRIYNQLRDDPRLPLINRAVQNHYPPGSTIKPLVAMAGLVAGKTPPNQIYYCPGYFELGGSKRYCAMRSGHGNLNMRQAIQRSCNVYFWGWVSS